MFLKQIVILKIFSLMVFSVAIEAATVNAQDLKWPRDHVYADQSKLTMYQPQIEEWLDYEKIRARMVIAFLPAGAKKAELGTITFMVDSQVDFDTRLVRLSDMHILEGNFPTLDRGESRRMMSRLQQLVPENTIIASLDRLSANLKRSSKKEKKVRINTTPPTILVSQKPAVLLIIDGAPVLSPIKNTDLKYVVNTNWDLFYIESEKTYYLRYQKHWLKSKDLKSSSWQGVGQLPASFTKLPKKDKSWKDALASIPPQAIDAKKIPQIFSSEKPAEMIVINGKPELELIDGTQIDSVTNTDSDLFYHRVEKQYYYLVSGRWFSTSRLGVDAWKFASDKLPADFADIPEDHEKARVLASVAGTPQAEEAILLNQIPRTVKVKRSEVKPKVVYTGEPIFDAIENTDVEYARNTSSDVILYKGTYYLCDKGIWFKSNAATGPWQVADSIPQAIYDIPEDSPVYHVTYVKVYDSTPTYVTVGYTSGYVGAYVAYGAIVYGTGWYYPPYVYWGPRYPIYYPYHFSYGVSAYYNPHTGTYGRGARVYGPYGGAGRGATYNPSTGTYARGAAAWGPYNSRTWAEAYNPRTGTYAKTRQGSNVYSQWGTSVVERGNQWARTGHYASDKGAIAGYKTSKGKSGVIVSGDQGRGAVVKGRDNNLFAGKDGNVYRHSDSGWQKYDVGNWREMDRDRDTDRFADKAYQSSKARQYSQSSDRNTMQNLNWDRRSRNAGSQRFQSSQSWRSNPSRNLGSFSSGSRGGGGLGRRR